MTVKTAQARIRLANTIESLLGYSVTKVSNSPAIDEKTYNPQGKEKSLYSINSDHSVLARAQKRQDLLLYRKEIESGALKAGQEITLSFLSQKLTLKAKNSDLVLSYYKFTQTGDELFRLMNYPVNKVYKQLINAAFEGEFELVWHALK